MFKSPDAKRQFYSQPEVASVYDDLRFGGASGAWVNAREIDLVSSLLPPFRRALDLGCGTGRLTRVLSQRGLTIGIDVSSAMLARARENESLPLAQGDAFLLPFADASFDAVVALRLMFHFAELGSLLRQVKRVLALGGAVVFDTFRWSPRAWMSLDAARWGGGVFVHPPAQVEQAAKELDLKIAKREDCFLFSPYVYRRLPLTVVRGLARAEAHLPARLRARVFWKLVRLG
jgi:SAM-dependent methyltransferase